MSALRLFNLQLARYPASAPLPVGLALLLVEPVDLLPVRGWVLLPPQRG